jgi:uncharacterized membrane protein
MITIHLFILVLALVLVFLAAIKLPEPPRISYGWMGVFLAILSLIVA